MPIDPEILRRLQGQRVEQQGIAALVRGIHTIAGLREWITLETIVLAPIPVQQHARWSLYALLTVPQRAADGTEGYLAPWGAVEWSWPERQVIQTLDLRRNAAVSQFRGQGQFIKRQATADGQVLDVMTQAQREQALFQSLEQLLSTPAQDTSQMVPLAPLYSALLPREIYAYYWTLIPASQAWLRPVEPSTASIYIPATPAGVEHADVAATVSAPTNAQATHTDATNQTPAIPESERLPAPPPDLSGRVEQWLTQALQLAETFHVLAITSELRTLEARQQLPGFRLAFVGEFNRGKSTLINRLLERPLLPVRVLPTTSTLTSIIAGTEERMEIFFPDARQEMRSLEEASWHDLLVNDTPGRQQTVFPKVRLTLKHPWLQSIDAELIDTPGAGDINDRRTALISEILNLCDATVLLVSAILPLSLTEAAFLEQEVLGRHIPRVLVVVSMLDTLPPEQQPLTLKAIRERVARISPAIPVIPAHPVAGMSGSEVLANIRTRISVMATASERRAWRSLQAADLLVDACEHLIQYGKTALAAVQMEETKRSEALQAVQMKQRKAELDWEALSLQLDQRRQRVDGALRRRLSEVGENLIETFYFELSKTPDPRSWWEKDFPFRLRRELLTLARNTETSLIDVLARDLKWLQDEIKQTFSADFSYQLPQAAPPPDVSLRPDASSIELSDIHRQRFLSRIASAAAMIAGYLRISPIGSAISLSYGLVSEHLLNKKIEEQRALLKHEVRAGISSALDDYERQITERLQTLYQQMLQEMKRQQDSWLAAQDAALHQAHPQPRSRPWQQLIDEATKLRHSILATKAEKVEQA